MSSAGAVLSSNAYMVSVFVAHGNVVTAVKGGYAKSIPADKALVLDASISYDEVNNSLCPCLPPTTKTCPPTPPTTHSYHLLPTHPCTGLCTRGCWSEAPKLHVVVLRFLPDELRVAV